MEVFRIARRLQNWGPHTFIARRFLGSLFEWRAEYFLRRRGYKILFRNKRFVGVEIDRVCKISRNGKSFLVVVEVRGRSKKDVYRPSKMLTYQKRARLQRAAEFISRRYKSAVRIEFIEVFGFFKRPVLMPLLY